jgi:DNA relaxase NicK
MTDFRCGVHWLSFVVFASRDEAFKLYDVLFKDLFGELEPLGHGGRGFKEIWLSLLAFKVYVTPSNGTEEYFHFEIPGRACELINTQIFLKLESILAYRYPDTYRYSRLDFAFDELSFTPQDVENAISVKDVRSHAKRETMKVHKTPFEKKDNGELGTHTVEFGSRQSERMIRVYNRRGFTRLELELKHKRADLVAKQIFNSGDASKWYSIVLPHLRDYVDFNTNWWKEFVSSSGRAWAIVSTPKEISQESITAWLEHQIAPALSVINDIRDDDFVKDLIVLGRTKRKRVKRYNLLLGKKDQKDNKNE